MKQFSKKIVISMSGIKLKEITSEIISFIKLSNIKNGILNLSIMHTTASLIIQENADPDVLKDIEDFYFKIAPMESSYNHSIEGIDDMPAHIKSSLTNSNLSISVIESELQLGTWQGIFLFEHRQSRRNRTILAHVLGE